MDEQPEEEQTLRLPIDYHGNPRFLPKFGNGITGAQKWVICSIYIEPAGDGDGHTLKLEVTAYDAERVETLWEDAHEFDLCVNKEMLPLGNRPVDVMSFITFHDCSLDTLGKMMFEHLLECCIQHGWEEADFEVSKEGDDDEAELVFTLNLHGEQPYTGRVVLPWQDFGDKYFITS